MLLHLYVRARDPESSSSKASVTLLHRCNIALQRSPRPTTPYHCSTITIYEFISTHCPTPSQFTTLVQYALKWNYFNPIFTITLILGWTHPASNILSFYTKRYWYPCPSKITFNTFNQFNYHITYCFHSKIKLWQIGPPEIFPT